MNRQEELEYIHDGILCTILHRLVNPLSDGTLVPGYTSNPNDIIPLVTENNISTTSPEELHCGDMWGCEKLTPNGYLCTSDKNPLRAAVVLLILLKEDE